MAEVTWFKVLTDIFSDDKIKIIQHMPEGDALLVMWFKVLSQAGKTNDGGYIYLNRNIPYSAGMLATLFGKSQQLVELALRTFSEFGMVDIDEKGYIFVTHWEKHQNIEGMDKVREQTRKRVTEHREKKKLELQQPAYICSYCGSAGATLDHIIPRSKGGADVPENCVLACKSCNSSKSNKSLADFLNDSVFLHYQNVKFDLVLKNEKLMRYVDFSDGKFTMKRYSNATVTQGNAIEVDIELEKDSTTTDETVMTVMDAYTQATGLFSCSPLISSFFLKVKGLGYTDAFLVELILEAGESANGKLSIKYLETIFERWDREKVYSRAQSREKKQTVKGSSTVGRQGKAAKWEGYRNSFLEGDEA